MTQEHLNGNLSDPLSKNLSDPSIASSTQQSETQQSDDSLAIAEAQYVAGKRAFEGGNYRRSIEALEQAVNLSGRNSKFGGEVQLWLVTAYQAGGQQQQAIDLCEQLEKHPDWQTRKQARRLVYILKAPQLKRPEEWITKIPDLSNLDEANGNSIASRYQTKTPPRPATPRPKPTAPPVDLSQVNTKDTGFVWVALGLVLLILGGLAWLSVA